MSQNYSEHSSERSFNPFPGLRPFSRDEASLFFGREGQSRSVLEHLVKNRFVAVVGASGSGKSSLIYCGVVPGLLKGSDADNWSIVAARPGNNPVRELYSAFASVYPEAFPEEKYRDLIATDISLQKWFDASAGGSGKVLLIIDQFEELFRYSSYAADGGVQNTSGRFIELLVNAARDRNSGISVVLTMRSDFIGECSAFQDLTELINESNYLIPQMTREDFRKAIVMPVEIGGAKVEDKLVDQLLDELGNNSDQLPVLQHAMMRTWDYWHLQNDQQKPLSVADYEAIGRMQKALSDHADEAFDELDEKQRAICESMFKTLTEKGGDNRGVRRPTSVRRIADIARCTPEEVIAVADHFRSKGRTFLTPYQPVALSPETIIDISHESLMRIWDRLRLWVDEEDESVQMYNRLADASGLYQDGRTSLWRPPDLQLALNWREKQRPTLTWAEQYSPAFERAIVYLETSDTEYRKEEENKIRLQRRRLRITRIFALILGGIAIVAMGLFLWTRDLQNKAEASAQEALDQKEIADSLAVKASQEAENARLAADDARIQQVKAEDASKLAEERRKEAVRASNLAEYRRLEAEKNLEEAKRQEKIANDNAEEATRQGRIARENAEEAYKRRMLSIARSMAVKSLQIDDDPDLKGLLAYQAYLYSLQYGEPKQDADIYAGLYAARKALLGEQYNVYEGHTQTVRALVFKPGTDEFFSAGSDGQILSWMLSDTSKSFTAVSNEAMVIEALTISSDGSRMACATDGNGIMVYNLDQLSEAPAELSGHNNIIRDVEFQPGSRDIFSIGTDKKILRWAFPYAMPEELVSSANRFTDIAVSTDGALLAACDRSGNIFIYPIKNSADTVTLPGSLSNPSLSLDFSSDGKYLAAGDLKGNVRLYSTTDWSLIISLRGNKARINSVKFSPDDSYLASTGNDGKVLVWEMKDLNNSPLVLEDNAGFVFSVAFSPDSRYMVSGSMEASRLVARPVRADMLAEGLCTMLHRNFTREEWEIYVGEDIDYIPTCPQLDNEN